jgi:hypothetical protein
MPGIRRSGEFREQFNEAWTQGIVPANPCAYRRIEVPLQMDGYAAYQALRLRLCPRGNSRDSESLGRGTTGYVLYLKITFPLGSM